MRQASSVLRRSARRAFTVLEMQVATLISALLMSATLVALDTTFKAYEINADAASSNVVTRIVVNRVLAMVRTGRDFRPLPDDVLANSENPVLSDYMEFVSAVDADGIPTEVSRIEYRYAAEGAQLRVWGNGEPEPDLGFEPTGPGELWLVRITLSDDSTQEAMLLDQVRSCRFVLRYGIGPRLERATMDLVVEPDAPESVRVASDAPPRVTRLVASAMPRRIGE